MFLDCSSLTILDLSSFNTAKVANFNSMFAGTFSKSPSTSTLIISENFVYGATETTTGSTQFTKATLNLETSIDTRVTVKRGTTIVS